MLLWIARIIAELTIVLTAMVVKPAPVVIEEHLWTTMPATTIVLSPTITVSSALSPIPKSTTQSTPQIPTSQTQLDIWISQSNWPSNLWSTVRRIVLCESGGIVGIATNPPHVGLMQANVNIWGRVAYDPIAELNQGYEIYKLQGWGAWSCY